jgi:hypothetical protein
MNKLLLALSIIASPLTANIKWDKEKHVYCSTNFMWTAKLDAQKYHELSLTLSQIIGHAMLRLGCAVSCELIDFTNALRDEASPESFVLLCDIEEFLNHLDSPVSKK